MQLCKSKCCIPLLNLPSCSACSFERGQPPTPMVRSAVVPNPQLKSTQQGTFKNEIQCVTRRSESSILQLLFSFSIAKDDVFCSSLSYLFSIKLLFFCFATCCLLSPFFLLACFTPDSHLTRLLWHPATESRNASCYTRVQFLPSLLTVRLRATRQSAAV